jgi:hypothetical protein
VHNIANNKITSLNLGYLHNMDFTKRSPDGTIYGLRANYSLFYKYEDFITWLKKEKIISKGDNHPGAQNVSSPLAGKECLSLGSEFIYLFDKNDYLYSCTAKVLVTDTAIRIHKNLLFKKWGDYYNYLNVAFKFNVKIIKILLIFNYFVIIFYFDDSIFYCFYEIFISLLFLFSILIFFDNFIFSD